MKQEKEEKPIEEVPSVDSAHYYLFFKDFTQESCGDAVAFILERNLLKQKPKHMRMLINSQGGEVSSAFALIDTMKGSPIPVHTYGLGEISSCGLMTFIAGQKGHRYITRNTSILSHQFSWGSDGKAHELFARVKEFNLTEQRMLEHYKRCTGQTEKVIREVLLPAQDVWLSAKEAIKYGIADKIVEFY